MRTGRWQDSLQGTSGLQMTRPQGHTVACQQDLAVFHHAGGSCAGSICECSQPRCAASRPKGLPDSACSSNSSLPHPGCPASCCHNWALPAAVHLLPCQRAQHTNRLPAGGASRVGSSDALLSTSFKPLLHGAASGGMPGPVQRALEAVVRQLNQEKVSCPVSSAASA